MDVNVNVSTNVIADSGEVPGFRYAFAVPANSPCILCGKTDVVLISMPELTSTRGICEYCSHAASWIWKRAAGERAPFPGTGGTDRCHVVVLDETPPGAGLPEGAMSVLMVARGSKDSKDSKDRKDSKEKGSKDSWFELPGGSRRPDNARDDEEAVRHAAESGIVTWRSALEPLWSGPDHRGRVIQIFLCRAYHLEAGASGVWKPWPPSAHAGPLAGVYSGLPCALDLRLRIHRRESDAETLSTPLRGTTVELIRTALGEIERDPADRLEICAALMSRLTPDERLVVDMIFAKENITLETRKEKAEVAEEGEEEEEKTDEDDDELPSDVDE